MINFQPEILQHGEEEVAGFHAFEFAFGKNDVLAQLESAAGEDEGHVFAGMRSRRHTAAVEDHGVIEKRAAVESVFFSFEQVDEVSHLRDLISFD